MAVMSEAIEQCGRHFHIAEDAGSFAEAQVCGDEHAGAFVKFAEQVEEQSAAGCAEREIAELVQDDEITTNQPLGNLPGFRCAFSCSSALTSSTVA